MSTALTSLWVRRQERFLGLVERCAPGAHSALASEIARLQLPKVTRILDVAAGSGAFLARVRALGFNQLSAIELNYEDFKLEGIPVESFDLNMPFAEKFTEKFDLITAIEIIEHLDNPRHLLRELRKLLNPGGHLIVTAPNTEHWLARMKFLIKGEPKHFGLVDINTQRHISPVLSYQMDYMFKEIGFTTEKLTSCGSFWGPLKKALYEPLGVLVRTFMRGCKVPGEMLVFIARAAEPEQNLLGHDSRYFATEAFALADHRL